MKKILIVLSCILFLSGITPDALAQEAATDGVQINQEQLDNLISTLESDEKREEFIGNLKTLSEASAETTEGKTTSLSELFGLDKPMPGSSI